MWAILWVLLTQIPCEPGEMSAVCHCKQGRVSACEVLRQTEPKLVDEIEKALALARVVEEGGRDETEAPSAEALVASAAPEPPDCKGQKHHVISRRIARELENHETLHGHYQARDPRLVAQARDEPSHCGYQSWHRDVDEEVIAWLKRYRRATPKEFEAFLREIYGRPAMKARFPLGF